MDVGLSGWIGFTHRLMIETRLLSVNVIERNYHVLVLHGTSGLGLHVRKSLLKAKFYLNSDIYVMPAH